MAALAVVLDAAALVLFVLLGRQAHEPGSGLSRFLTVLWPFLVGWFVVAAVSGLHWARTRPVPRLAATILAGVALALAIRFTVTGRGVTVAFTVVSYAFIALMTVGWRLLWLAGRRGARPRVR